MTSCIIHYNVTADSVAPQTAQRARKLMKRLLYVLRLILGGVVVVIISVPPVLGILCAILLAGEDRGQFIPKYQAEMFALCRKTLRVCGWVWIPAMILMFSSGMIGATTHDLRRLLRKRRLAKQRRLRHATT